MLFGPVFNLRLKLVARRAVAWWIDGFLVAAITVVLRWTLQGSDTTATPEFDAAFRTIAPAVIFFFYRILIEACTGTSLGKWSMRLRVHTPGTPWPCAALRNAWLLLPMLGLSTYVNDEYLTGALLLLGAIGVATFGVTPWDKLAGASVKLQTATT
ncbi:RDD family protein [Corynebacterium lizhenjunii]|uniref:RDD family protein n=1 Tax=Corynebacterium lizhenjunii TaxID=2709394 RepID=A0A7T0KGH0_9CORY|nr:RDD family protein [Corynebacterium lizhenjunii]QPK80107.1 RDD family protein [Corynebacterium lizhenjunii]